MYNTQTSQLIIEVLAFSGFEECPKMVDSRGEFVYNENGDPKAMRTVYMIDKKGVKVQEYNEWFYLRPEFSLDHLAFLITRAHNSVHVREKTCNSDIERQALDRLHTLIIQSQRLVATFENDTVLNSLALFIDFAHSLKERFHW
jgi:hypothetical protein